MTRQPSSAVLLSEELDEFLGGFPSSHKYPKWIRQMALILKENIYAGDRIQRERIPPFYIRKYNVRNLYRYSHPEGFRSSYTIISKGELRFCPLIIDLLSHQEYDKIFGYS